MSHERSQTGKRTSCVLTHTEFKGRRNSAIRRAGGQGRVTLWEQLEYSVGKRCPGQGRGSWGCHVPFAAPDAITWVTFTFGKFSGAILHFCVFLYPCLLPQNVFFQKFWFKSWVNGTVNWKAKRRTPGLCTLNLCQAQGL